MAGIAMLLLCSCDAETFLSLFQKILLGILHALEVEFREGLLHQRLNLVVAEMCIRDSLQAAYRMTNRNPLGSAAGYGSSFPLNRIKRAYGTEQDQRWTDVQDGF